MTTSILEVEDLVAGYGGGEALHGVSLTLRSGEVACLLGPNGAGKTTLLRAVAGAVQARAGRVLLGSRDVTHAPAHARARRGISMVPEERSAFADLTVDQNLLLGAIASRRARDRAWVASQSARVFEVFPRLADRRSQLAGTLSGGEQKMLVIGRALMSSPSVLLVDEPSQGLAPQALDAIATALRELHEQFQLSILVAEQNMARALGWADRAFVLSGGLLRHEGKAAALRDDDALMERLYLGDAVDG